MPYFPPEFCFESSYHEDREQEWTDVEDWLKELALQHTEEWTDELKSHEYLMYERNEGGGLFGVSPDHSRIRELLIADGKLIITARKEEERINRLNRGLHL